MNPTLYPHQQKAVEFLSARARAGLFDDMGLGKTASAICSAIKVGARRTLVVCPTVVTRNWRREIRTWDPTAEVQVITRGTQSVNPSVRYVIVSHGLLIRPPLLAQLVRNGWDVVIADESHALKNPKAKRTRAFFDSIATRGTARHVWLLTGTPMPNDPTEMWSMLRGLAPERITGADGRPMTWRQFRERYCVLAPSSFTPDGVRVVGARNIPELRDRMRGFSLRRLKAHVLDLPPIRWGNVSLTVEKLPKELLALEKDLPRDPAAALAQLRDGSQFSTWRRLCGLAKADAAAELLYDELDAHAYKKVVVFAHHIEVLDILQMSLRDFRPVRISGDVLPDARARAVDAFQNDPETRVAVCNLVAGGVGITLTAASEVVFAEASFVPGDMKQAADRCHRIGQAAPVNVRVLSLAGSVDELVGDILVRKTSMIRDVLGE